jgi:integrase/recombinase XerC
MLDNFQNYLKIEKRFSEHTCLAYKKDLEQFIDFSAITKLEELKEITAPLIRGWMVDLLENTYTKRSVNRKLSSLRTYFKWLRKNELIDTNPMQRITGPKSEKRLPSFVSAKDLTLEKLTPLFKDDFEGVRDRLMLEMFYQTGMRLSELIGIKEQDVEPKHIRVLGKRNKERLIPISHELYQSVVSYKKCRNEQGVKGDFLFLLINGNKLYPKLVYRKIYTYLGEITSLEKRSPHILRHTFATHMLNNGAGLETLKDILGHANLSATQVYTHNSFTQLTRIYSQAHPRGHKKK